MYVQLYFPTISGPATQGVSHWPRDQQVGSLITVQYRREARPDQHSKEGHFSTHWPQIDVAVILQVYFLWW